MNRRLAFAGVALGLMALSAPLLRAGAANLVTVIQSHRAFSMAEVRLKRGDTVRFTNDDLFNHQVYVKSPTFSFDSAEQAPGEAVNMAFPVAGTFDVLCGMHPRMHLAVTVE
jgi:plastocyanin